MKVRYFEKFINGLFPVDTKTCSQKSFCRKKVLIRKNIRHPLHLTSLAHRSRLDGMLDRHHIFALVGNLGNSRDANRRCGLVCCEKGRCGMLTHGVIVCDVPTKNSWYVSLTFSPQGIVQLLDDCTSPVDEDFSFPILIRPGSWANRLLRIDRGFLNSWNRSRGACWFHGFHLSWGFRFYFEVTEGLQWGCLILRLKKNKRVFKSQTRVRARITDIA